MKTIIFCLLTALVLLTFKTDSSYSIPTIPKYDENYWTLEKMKNAKPLTIRNRTRSDIKTIKNTTDFSKYTKSTQPFERKYDANGRKVDQDKAIPIGLLFVSKNDDDFTCTASVIDTDNGNIGLTAAHCLYDQNTRSYFDNVMFAPGFDNGQPAPIGKIPIAKMVVTNEFIDDNDDEFDWGMMLFNFNMNGLPLKHFTGALAIQFQPGDNIQTTFRGYPNGGNLENCPNNGQVLCTWQGVTTLADDFYVVADVNLGEGASGGPLMMNYDPNVNLGTLYSNYASFDELNDQLLGPIYDQTEFQELINELTQ
ncbi:hypothetical protein RclHR1_09830007 [Rhizophagus clarus]|uniref:Trypsin-like serine protease n=1 Tax=Rhizophagus clarus TaxID=94130 RepID=A0A2Z6S5Q9_9GLOM|nr:hypothetical protein RclHR1_09830007 [Rhizophagus clarus]GES81489.1 trypsin-like serine protease [Rhizophagus clarus]